MNISKINWSTSHYFASPLRAFISLGAAPGENNQTIVEYNVTVTDSDFVEQSQETFQSLEEALTKINEKYSHWKMIDANEKTTGDGCSSCAAH
jgi:hypothetical protein